MQERQKAKERVLLKEIMRQVKGCRKSSDHEDRVYGYDVTMPDGKRYDIKASVSGKLTMFKEVYEYKVIDGKRKRRKVKNEAPLFSHLNIPYLIPYWYDGAETGYLYVVDKIELVKAIWARGYLALSTYDGDGNVNYNFELPPEVGRRMDGVELSREIYDKLRED